MATALATNSVARYRHLASRPITRHVSLALVARHPRLLKADLAYEGFFKGAGKPGFDEALRASLDYDFRDRLPEVKVPTLIVWGEKDSIIPTRDADEFERLIEDSRKVVMRDTGHIPMAERPDAFNRVVTEFLAETGPAEEKEPATASRRRLSGGSSGTRAQFRSEPTRFAYFPSTPLCTAGAPATGRRRRAPRSPRRASSTLSSRFATSNTTVSPSLIAAIGPPRRAPRAPRGRP